MFYCNLSQIIESEMDVQVQRFDDLNDVGQELVHLLDSQPETVQRINTQLTSLQDRWDALVHQMEAKSKEVKHFKKNATL